MVSVSCLCSVYIRTVASQFHSSIDSLLAGSLHPDEIIVVVDGPISSELDRVISSYSDLGEITVVRLPANQGLAHALNAGLRVCACELVCRFDTDDINLSTRLEEICVAFKSEPTLDIIGSSIYEFTEYRGRLQSFRLKRAVEGHDSIARTLDFLNPINHPSVAFRRNSIVSIGGYIHMPYFEDYYLWLIARRHGLRFANITKPLVCMRATELLARRTGIKYLLYEADFCISAFRNKLIRPQLLPYFLLRLAMRLFPRLLDGCRSICQSLSSNKAEECPELTKWLALEKHAGSEY